MTNKPEPPTWTRRLTSGAILFALLALAPATTTVSAADPQAGDPPASHPFQGSYAGGLAADAAGPTSSLLDPAGAIDQRGCVANEGADLCPMAGVTLCDLGSLVGVTAFGEGLNELGVDVSIQQQSSPTFGGSCGDSANPRLVRGGDTVLVAVEDASGSPVTYGVCVDGNGNGLCRPEGFEAATDTWVMHDASEPGALAFQHGGASGLLYVFLFSGAGSVPTTGSVWGSVDTATSRLPECADGLDNDADGGVDSTDLGCVSQVDGDERGDEAPSAPAPSARCLAFESWRGSSYFEQLTIGTCGGLDLPTCVAGLRDCPLDIDLPECMDGANNDPPTDGSTPDGTDYPFDPDCTGPTDDRERGPACSDHIDNDGDGRTDYPSDPGCTGPTDDDEYNVWACSDGRDNDGDTRRDYPSDPGCTGPYDDSEDNVWACSDGFDNDRDGVGDYPRDPGCFAWYDNDERNPRPAGN